MKNSSINIIKAIVYLIAVIIITQYSSKLNYDALLIIGILLVLNLLHVYQLTINGIEQEIVRYRITTTSFVIILTAIIVLGILCIVFM